MVTALASGALKRPGQAARRLGRADGAERGGCLPAFARDMAGERLEAGERALQRAAADALGAPAGEEGAQVAGAAVGEIRNARGLAEPLLEEGEKLPGVAPVRLDRAGRQSPLAREMGEPGGGRRGEVGRSGECGQFGEVVGLGHGQGRLRAKG